MTREELAKRIFVEAVVRFGTPDSDEEELLALADWAREAAAAFDTAKAIKQDNRA